MVWVWINVGADGEGNRNGFSCSHCLVFYIGGVVGMEVQKAGRAYGVLARVGGEWDFGVKQAASSV